MSYQTAATYRVDFTLRIIRALLEVFVFVIVISVLFSHNPTLAGWSQHQTMLVFSLALLIGSLAMFIWGSGLEDLDREIVNGTLDRFLLQPMDAQWLASTRVMYITNLFRLLFNFGFLIYVLLKLQINFQLFSLVLFLINLISALVIYYSVMFIASSISFWSFSGELFYLFNSLTSIVRYPLDIFHQGLKLLFTFIPLIFIATIPAQILISRPSFLAFLSPLTAIATFLFTRFLWHQGLKHYESASS